MSAYKQQEHDFIKRTQKIILQYDDYFKDKKDSSERYEVTLLINAFVGLLILPQQEWFKHLPNDLVSEDIWGIDQTHIAFIKIGETKSIKSVATHLRNSVAHYNFTVFKNQENEIAEIRFLDYKEKENINRTFEATIPVKNLRRFLNHFSEIMIEKMVIAKGSPIGATKTKSNGKILKFKKR